MKSSEDKRKIVAVDLDGTLTKQGHFPDIWNLTFLQLEQLYEDVEPNEEMISKINMLYDRDYIIYIFTSRWDLYQKQTVDWLKKNNVKHHFLQMNKNFYDYIIDDKVVPTDKVDEVFKLPLQLSTNVGDAEEPYDAPETHNVYIDWSTCTDEKCTGELSYDEGIEGFVCDKCNYYDGVK